MTDIAIKMGLCALLLGVGAGCAGSSELTRRDVLRQYDRIGELSEAVTDLSGRDAGLLVPDGFARAQELLDGAIGAAKEADKKTADALAEEGLSKVAEVEQKLDRARQTLEEVLATRSRAIREGATALMPEDMKGVDDDLRKAAGLLESDAVKEATQRRPALMTKYADLELRALKAGLTAAAEQAVKQAQEEEADEYAPRTFEAAQEELRLVRAVLETDRTQREKAEQHARRAISLSGQARALTQLAVMFEKQDYDHEDILLWHQAQLQNIGAPLDSDLPFDESDQAAVTVLRRSIESLLSALSDARATTDKTQQRITQLRQELEKTHSEYQAKLAKLVEEQQEQLTKVQNARASQLAKLQSESKERMQAIKERYEGQLSDEARARAELERHARQEEQRYEQVQSMFSEQEAMVSRQGKNVRLDVHGFDFRPSEAHIGAANFGLLNRIVSAINMFPESRVRIGGHTDSKGNEDRNLRLSLERATAVSRFLSEVGGIALARLETEGYGETRPVASNDSPEGRAKNRRIEVLIINEQQPRPQAVSELSMPAQSP